MTKDDAVPVTQLAREAVAKQVEEAFYDECEYAQEMRQGLHDSDPNLQHFARFERDILARSRSEVGCTIPADHPLAKGLRTSQKALDEIKRQEQANIAGYLAVRDMPIGSVAADALHQSGRTGAGEALREAARAVLADADRPGSRMLLGDDKTPDSWIEYREVGQVELDALAAALSQSTAGEDKP